MGRLIVNSIWDKNHCNNKSNINSHLGKKECYAFQPMMQASGFVRLSRKASLISAAASIPKAVAVVKETMILPGYITGITNDACYVRFLGQLTGRAGLAQLADSFVSDPSRHYTVGQSVRAQVVQVRVLLSVQHVRV